MKKNKNIVLIIILIVIIALLSWILLSKEDQKIPLEFSLKQKMMEIKIGDSIAIDYDLNKDATIKWEIEDEKVVTVYSNTIKAVGFGSTTIKGTVTIEDETITDVMRISTYIGSKNSSINNINVPDGELFITKDESYEIPIEYDPEDAYITSIEYGTKDEEIANYIDGVVYANKKGMTTIYVTINGTITKKVIVNVIGKKIEPIFSKKVERINIDEDNISLKPGESKKIEYTVEPNNAFIDSIKWESSDSNIAYVDDDEIIAKSSGNATIKLIINDEISKEINVLVSIPVTSITINSSLKLSLKVNGTAKIDAQVVPANATNKKLSYTSSNSNIVSVDEAGNVIAVALGSGNITIKSLDSNISMDIPFTVTPSKGYIEGGGNIWGYTSSLDKTPVRADTNFFQNLASNGKGVLSGDIYTLSTANKTYSYNISKSTLTVDNQSILMRIYYPPGVDLSKANTFTFFGGSGERNMSGYFSDLNKDTSSMQSSGIIILVSAREKYNASDGINSTEFVRNIVNQKDGVRNAVGGYSMSGGAAGKAATDGIYDRLIIFDSYFDNVKNNEKLRKMEIVFYSPVGDSMINSTLGTLNTISSSNYTNVTLVTNNSNLNHYSSSLLVVNPGNQMGNGHGNKNITKAKVFSYACS